MTLAAGVTGVVVAHVVGYVLAFSNGHERAHVLHDTGHGYFSIATWAALGAGALAVVVVVAKGAASQSRGSRGTRAVPRFGALTVWQGCLFLAAEVAERLAAGAPLGEMVHGREVLLGLAVQVLVAALVVLVLGGTALVSARIAAALRRPRPMAACHTALPWSQTSPALAVRPAGTRSRAPPVPGSAIF